VSDTATEAPAITSGAHQRIVDVLSRELGDEILEHVMQRGDLWVRVSNAAWHRTVEVCKRQLGLTFFSFLAGMDWLPVSNGGEKVFKGEEGGDDDDEADAEVDEVVEDDEDEAPSEMVTGVAGGATRFQVLCRLYDVTKAIGVTLKADLDEHDPRVASLTDLYRGADWHEREAWEFYGFVFDGHPGLRHLYLPGEFEGNPGRKDFPLLARELKPWPGLVNVEQIPDHLDPKKIAAAAAEADATAAPAADAVPAEQAVEAQADLPVTAEAPVAQAAPEAANDAAADAADAVPATEAEGSSE
jgi:NADH-quinone oxidoreductase subunit C